MTKKFLKNIHDIKNCGVFNEWPRGNVAFGRYNLIYGWNGSGKTTLSRILRSLEKGVTDTALSKDGADPSFQFQLLDDTIINSKNLTGWQKQVRVFNGDFVRENINADTAEAQPVYHLGKDQGDALEQLSKLKQELDKQKAALAENQQKHKDATDLLDGSLTNNARIIRDSNTGQANFDARKLRTIVDKFKTDGIDVNSIILKDEEITAVLSTARGNNDKAKIGPLVFSTIKSIDKIHAEAEQACKTSVTKAAIEELDKSSPLRDWVKQGFDLHKNKKTCGFCASKLEDSRITLLEQYFNAAYEALGRDIATAKHSISTLLKDVDALVILDKSNLYQEVRPEYERCVILLAKATGELKSFCMELDKTLVAKKDKLTEIVAVLPLKEMKEKFHLFTVALNTINAAITTHNQQHDNFEVKTKEARNKIISHYSASYFSAYTEALQRVEDLSKKGRPIQDAVKKLEDEAKILDAKLRQHDVAVERINELLASFIGRNDIKLVTHEKGYFIEREGIKAENLSEGEKTAIAFTYFIAKMEEKEFNIEESVVVVDDPISSLDTNALYAAGSFIRLHLERASQVIIFTHNYQFFREIFGWMKGIKHPKEDKWHKNIPYKSHLMLKCEVSETGKRTTKPYPLDETLSRYDTEYLFLFQQLYKARGTLKFSENTVPDDLAKLMMLPNLARRVLETFVLFKFPHASTGQVINLFNATKHLGVQIAPERVSVLDRLLNRGSHGGEDGMTTINMFTLSETPKVIDYVLDFIEKADSLHFSGLKKAIGIDEHTVPKATQPNDNKHDTGQAA